MAARIYGITNGDGTSSDGGFRSIVSARAAAERRIAEGQEGPWTIVVWGGPEAGTEVEVVGEAPAGLRRSVREKRLLALMERAARDGDLALADLCDRAGRGDESAWQAIAVVLAQEGAP